MSTERISEDIELMSPGFVCWDMERVSRVLQTEALTPEPDVFTAAHVPMRLVRKRPQSRHDDGLSYNEHDFLKEFESAKDFLFVPVLGTTGLGKSHLIRWLYFNIQRRPDREILLIPRRDTNLKSILLQILDLDPDSEETRTLRAQLSSTAGGLRHDQAAEYFLSLLAQEVGPNRTDRVDDPTDIEDYLIERLGDLLLDPFFKKEYFLKRGGVIERLVKHALGSNGQREKEDDRVLFTLEDIPARVADLQRAGPGAAELFTDLVSDAELRTAAVAWINKNLHHAVTRLLQVRVSDLPSLMTRVRQSLARQGKELVLLIEDFMQTQGIDAALLGSLVDRSHSGTAKMCAMKTVIACTDGFFRPLWDTIQSRTSFVVYIDSKLDSVQRQNLEISLAARYLNLARLPEDELRVWWRTHPGDRTPSACIRCEHQTACHRDFGEADGYGLYPFNRHALRKFNNHVSPDEFNPRKIIDQILKHTLTSETDRITLGTFPSDALEKYFGGDKLSADARIELHRADPEHAGRRTSLLSFWGSGGSIKAIQNLPPSIHKAFQIPMLDIQIASPDDGRSPQDTTENNQASDTVVVTEPTRREKTTTQVAIDEGPQLPAELVKKLDALEAWQQGKKLQPQPYREPIERALVSRIDWNTEQLTQDAVKDLFKLGWINFQNQYGEPTGSSRQFSLKLPLPGDEAAHVAVALKALLLHEHHCGWNFPDAAKLAAAYANQLERWTEAVLENLRRPILHSDKENNLVPDIARSLAVSAAIAGRVPEKRSPAAFVDCVLTVDTVGPAARRNAKWTQLRESLERLDEPLRQVLLARTYLAKGGMRKAELINPSDLLRAFQHLKENELLPNLEDMNLRRDFEGLQKAADLLKKRLPEAIAGERAELSQISEQILTLWPADQVSKDDLIKGLEAAIASSKNVPMAATSQSPADIRELLKSLRAAPVSEQLDLLTLALDDSGGAWSSLCSIAAFEQAKVAEPLAALRVFSDWLDAVESNCKRLLQDTPSGAQRDQEVGRLRDTADALAAELEAILPANGGPL